MFISSTESATARHSALIHHLGGATCVIPVPADASSARLEVGALGGLPAWSLTATANEARAVARQLARRGELGVLLATDPSTGVERIAVTLLPVRMVILGPDPFASLPIRRAALALRHARDNQLAQAIALAESLDVDAAGRKTFSLLRELLDRGVALLSGRISQDARHAWTLVQLTRLLFLRFVEAEGWLDGNPHFLADAIDRCLRARRDPTRHLLQPLFFGTLNRPYQQRSRFARAFGDVPFLNGGLFEPHAVERRYAFQLPTPFWRDAFSALVDRVDVTLDAEATDGRVTPELLGRVFEGVMNVDERKEQGAFFTPPPLVDAIVRQALTAHLAHRLGRREGTLERQLDDPDPELARTLLDVTVLDPAAGSGAFLVGALALLHGPGARRAGRVRHLVTRRLFGVDRHPDAVRLAELRLWLEVLRSLRGRSPRLVPPLPNLDATVRAGDALLDPLARHALPVTRTASLSATQRALAAASGREKLTLLRRLRDLEREGILAAMTRREDAISREIDELTSKGEGVNLFGERARLERTDNDRLRMLHDERMHCRRERNRVINDQQAAPFAVAAAFAPLLARRGGFDLVVGNPPWVRAERLAARTRQELAARYHWWKSAGSGWRHLPDLSIAFVERSFELLRPDGTLALLVPAKVATAGYGRACREALAERSTLHHVADLATDERAGFDATTYPLAIIASRRVAKPAHRVHLGLARNSDALPQEAWRNSEVWLLGGARLHAIATKLAEAYPPIAETAQPCLGVKTGANAAFLNPPESLAEWARPALRGRDIRAFQWQSRSTLLWPADRRGEPLRTLTSSLLKHFEPHRDTLTRRADLHDTLWWRLFRTTAATSPHRVVWGDLARRLEATTVADPMVIPINSCYVASMPTASAAVALSGWLNSTWVRALARLRSEPAAGGAARFGARAVGGVPLPPAALSNPRLVALSVDAQQSDVSVALDKCCAELLGLDQNDREILAPLAAHRR